MLLGRSCDFKFDQMQKMKFYDNFSVLYYFFKFIITRVTYNSAKTFLWVNILSLFESTGGRHLLDTLLQN